MPMRCRPFYVVLVCLVAALGMEENCFSGPGGQQKTSTYKVPTSGQILDVIYQAEFDEWWIKCREKDAVVVYTLDQRTGKWGSVKFVPGKPSDGTLAKSPARKEEPNEQKTKKESNPTLDLKLTPQEPKEEAASGQDKPSVQPERPKEVKKKESSSQDSRKQWWNPLKVLEKGKELFKNPVPKEDGKKPNPDE